MRHTIHIEEALDELNPDRLRKHFAFEGCGVIPLFLGIRRALEGEAEVYTLEFMLDLVSRL